MSKITPAELDRLREGCRMTRKQAARFLRVDRTTYGRWQHRGAPWWVGLLLAYEAGVPPWSDWDGWSFSKGAIWPPGYRVPVIKGEILAIPYHHQLVAELKRQVREFRELDDQAQVQPSGERQQG